MCTLSAIGTTLGCARAVRSGAYPHHGNVSPKPCIRMPRPDFGSTLLPLPDHHVLLPASAYTRETGRQTRGHFHEARGFLRRFDVPSTPDADLPTWKPST